MVLCIQTVGSDEQALLATDCQHLLKPKTLVSCNRDILCPSDWTVGNWSEVSSGLQRGTGIVYASLSPSPSSSLTKQGDPREDGTMASGRHLWPVSCIFRCLYSLLLVRFLQDLPLTCPVLRSLPGTSWVLLAPAPSSTLINRRDFCWPFVKPLIANQGRSLSESFIF